METLEGIGKILSGAMTLKAEIDYWNSHSDSYKATIWAQILFGIVLGAVAHWAYSGNPEGTPNSTVPVLFFYGYVSVCWALNSQRSLDEKSFASQNFSEFWLFGFFKGDDYMGGVIFGWILAALCAYGIFSTLVLHQTIPTSLFRTSSAPYVVLQSPAPVTRTSPKNAAHKSAPKTRHHIPATHAH
ncbi:hypothetical protein BH10CYA1_BH10CYA1_17470 [soil metagenome]